VSIAAERGPAGRPDEPPGHPFRAPGERPVGEPLTIGTGSRHSRMTTSGNVSDHWGGNAADIPATGRNLIRSAGPP
jgi:hypothetical protein